MRAHPRPVSLRSHGAGVLAKHGAVVGVGQVGGLRRAPPPKGAGLRSVRPLARSGGLCATSKQGARALAMRAHPSPCERSEAGRGC